MERNGVKQRGEQRRRTARLKRCFLEDAAEFFTSRLTPQFGRPSLRHDDSCRWQDRQVDSWKKPSRKIAPHPAEVGVDSPGDVYRHHRCAGTRRRKRGTFVNFHHGAGHGDASFRKDGDRLVRFKQTDDRFDGPRAHGVHYEMGKQPENQPEVPLGGDSGMNQPHGNDGQKSAKQQWVDKGLMIRDKQQPAGLRHRPGHLNPV